MKSDMALMREAEGYILYNHLSLNLMSSPILLLLKNLLSVFCESSEMSIVLLKLPSTELIEVDKMGLL